MEREGLRRERRSRDFMVERESYSKEMRAERGKQIFRQRDSEKRETGK